MITQWNDTEDDLLQGLPLRAQVIYLRGLRRYMNYKTGIVGGVERRISLTMLGEIACEEFNRKLQSPTKDGVRSSLEQLKRVGLIERVEDKDYLIFFLPKATVNNSVQNNNPTTTPQQPHNNPTHNTTEKPSNDVALAGEQRTAQNGAIYEEALTTPHIRITDNGLQESIEGSYLDIGAKAPKPQFKKPTLAEVSEQIAGKGYMIDAELFIAHYDANGWMVGKNKMKCWKSALVTWAKRAPKVVGNSTQSKIDRNIAASLDWLAGA